ncbi:hypothetical protein CCP3SC5AM1_1260005 [Gammaproteobacteria bacterium]
MLPTSSIQKTADMFSPAMASAFKQYAKPVGIGAGIGAAGMGLADALGPKDEEEQGAGDRATSILKSMALGGALGGGLGGGYQAGKTLFGHNPAEDAMAKMYGSGKDHYSWMEALKGVTNHPGKVGLGVAGLPFVRPTLKGTGNILNEIAGKKPETPKSLSLGVQGMRADNPQLEADWKKLENAKKLELDDVYKAKVPQKPNVPKGYKYDPAAKDDPVKAMVDSYVKDRSSYNSTMGRKSEDLKKFMEGKQDYFNKSEEKFNAARTDLGNVLGSKAPSRDALERVISYMGRSGGGTYAQDKNWNPFAGKSKSVAPQNQEFYRMREALPPNASSYMHPLQKIRAAVQNNIYAPFRTWMDKRKDIDPFKGESGNPIKFWEPSVVQRGEMPWYAKGHHVTGNGGTLSKYLYKPEALIPKYLQQQKVPWHYGRGKYMAAPVLGAGAYGATKLLNKGILSLDTPSMLQSLNTEDPEYLQQLIDYAKSHQPQ